MKQLIFCLFLLPTLAYSQGVNWISFADLSDSLQVERKPVLVFITADWCPYCKLQDRRTFSKPKVQADLKDFYCIRLDAEESERITFLNRHYDFQPTGYRTGTHALAKFLGTVDGQLVLPTSVLLNEQLQLVKQENGYMDPAYFRRWLRK